MTRTKSAEALKAQGLPLVFGAIHGLFVATQLGFRVV